MAASPDRVDHLVFACRDLDEGTDYLERLLGVAVTPGGQHLGLGTRNALVGLGPGVYLELVGPDPDQPDPEGPRWFRVDELQEPRLVTWAMKGTDLRAIATAASAAGVDLGRVSSGGRRQPDGSELRWRLTDPRAARAGGVIPFFIDWGEAVHPSRGLPPGCSLTGVTLIHPDSPAVEAQLLSMGVAARVERGPRPGITATLATPRGSVELV